MKRIEEMYMTTHSRTELINQLKDFPLQLDTAVSDLNDEQLDTRYRVEGWTVRQVVHHVADSHMNAFIRMKLAITEDRPRYKTYEQDDWALLPDTRYAPTKASLLILRGLHERWANLLEKLPAESWTRTGVHPENGEVTLDEMLASYVAHGARHLRQITILREARGW